MSKEREKINLSNKWYWSELVQEEDIYDDNDIMLYESIEVTLNNYEQDHGGSASKTTVFRRISDNKYFEMNSTHAYDYLEFDDNEAYEVFPVEQIVKTIVYE